MGRKGSCQAAAIAAKMCQVIGAGGVLKVGPYSGGSLCKDVIIFYMEQRLPESPQR